MNYFVGEIRRFQRRNGLSGGSLNNVGKETKKILLELKETKTMHEFRA